MPKSIMPKKETNKYFYIISVLVALLVIGITITASFAFFTNSGSPTGTATVITSGSMSLELVDGDVVGITQGMLPGQKVQKKFKVRNTGTVETKYDIYLSEILNTFEDKSDLVYRLISEDGGYNSSSDREVPSSVGTSSKIVPGTSIGANEEHNYILEIEFLNKNENQDDNKGKKFSAKIQINDYKEYVIATLDTGGNVNIKLKQLANPDKSNIYESTYDENVTSIQRANQLDNTKTIEVISSSESAKEVYAWYDNGTIYYYTEANIVALNDNSSRLFYCFKKLNDLDVLSFETPHLTNISYMFNYTALTSLDLSSWDISDVTSVDYIIDNSSVEELNISGWDFSNVNQDWNSPLNAIVGDNRSDYLKRFIGRNLKGLKRMDRAFANNWILEYIDLTGTDTSQVTTFSEAFKQNYLLTQIDGLEDFDTSNAENMYMMFYGCRVLGFLNLSNWNTSNVIDMGQMFDYLYELKSLDISSFDTSNVTNMYGMFSDCKKIETIYVGSGWNTSQVTNGNSMFNLDAKLVGGAGTIFDSNHTDTSYAHVDEGSSNPGYFTYKANNNNNNNTSNQDPVISYKYWNDDYEGQSYNTYLPTQTPEVIYPNYTSLITGSQPSAFIRSTFENGTSTKHSVCLYYNNNVFCIEPDYWLHVTGSSSAGQEGADMIKDELKQSMEEALGVSATSCTADYSYVECRFDNAVCAVENHIDDYVACWVNSHGCTSYSYDGGAYCS